MGWWTDDKGLLVGDGPLDITEEFLERLKDEYVAERGRHPSLHEILGCVAAVLRYRAGDFAEGCDDLVVDDVAAKTRKRSKKQPLRPGDVFMVPLPSGVTGFGRATPQMSRFEFFELKGATGLSMATLRNIARFEFPALIALDPLYDRRWRVIGQMPFSEGGFKVKPFRIGGQVECGDAVRNGFIDPSSRLRAATAQDMRTVPPHDVWNAEMLEQQLEKRLAAMRQG